MKGDPISTVIILYSENRPRAQRALVVGPGPFYIYGQKKRRPNCTDPAAIIRNFSNVRVFGPADQN